MAALLSLSLRIHSMYRHEVPKMPFTFLLQAIVRFSSGQQGIFLMFEGCQVVQKNNVQTGAYRNAPDIEVEH